MHARTVHGKVRRFDDFAIPTMPPLKPNPRLKRKAVRRPSSATDGPRKAKTSAASARPDAAEAAWRGMYHQLVDFQRQRGHCDVPASRPYRALTAWLETQRELHARGRLAAPRVAQLDELGLDLSPVDDADGDTARSRGSSQPHEEAWEARFAELAAFHRRFGHTRVTKSWKENHGLPHWRHFQRVMYREGKLDPARKARLDTLGFEWEEPDRFGQSRAEHCERLWQTRYDALAEFKRRFGHCVVPKQWPEDQALSDWVRNQWYLHRGQQLRPDRVASLNALQFEWEPGRPHFDAQWEARYAELAAFHRRFGHTRVTKSWKENHGLPHWRHFQRVLHREGKLDPERKIRLEALGFEFAEPDEYVQTRIPQWAELWEQKFQDLVAYRDRFGDCLVPTIWAENPSLGAFVQKLRREHRRGWMPADRKARLESLGFAWDSDYAYRSDAWEDRFAELAAFHRRFGHLRVTREWKESTGLASWLDHQKEKRRAGTLEPERLARLDALGFSEQQRTAARRSFSRMALQIQTTIESLLATLIPLMRIGCNSFNV